LNPSPYYFDTLYRSTKADWDAFVRWTDFLPRRAESEPYHSGPHSLQRFRAVYELVRPKTVLEIGFNLGHSTVIWLELGVRHVTALEPNPRLSTCMARDYVTSRYGGVESEGGRFGMTHESSRTTKIKGPFDLMFVDGSHEREWVESDIALGKALRVPYFLMDDYDSHHGPGVVDAVQAAGLIPVALFGTMLLCRPPDLFTQRSDPLGSNYYE
jgi:hypothetical protein